MVIDLRIKPSAKLISTKRPQSFSLIQRILSRSLETFSSNVTIKIYNYFFNRPTSSPTLSKGYLHFVCLCIHVCRYVFMYIGIYNGRHIVLRYLISNLASTQIRSYVGGSFYLRIKHFLKLPKIELQVTYNWNAYTQIELTLTSLSRLFYGCCFTNILNSL